MRDWRVKTRDEFAQSRLATCNSVNNCVLGVRLGAFKEVEVKVIPETVDLITSTGVTYTVKYTDLILDRELTTSGKSHVGTFIAKPEAHDPDVMYLGRKLSQWRFKTREELGEIARAWCDNKQ